MSLFGNTFIQENKIKEDNNGPLIIVMDVDLDDFHWNLLLELQKKYNNVVLQEKSSSTQKFTIKDKDESQNVVIFIRNRKDQGGTAGKVAQHDASIKIHRPSKLNISLSVPRHDSNKEIEIIGEFPPSYKKAESNVKKFIKDNAYELRNIFYSDNPNSIEKSYKKLIRDNDNIELYGTNENDDVYQYYLSYKKGTRK